MPKDFIKVNQEASPERGRELVRFKDDVRALLDLGNKIKGVMDHNVTGADYVDIETLFGLPTGNGDEVYNLITGTLGALKGTVQSADALTLIDRVG